MSVLEEFGCPKCGGTKLRVLDTRMMKGHVRRRRQCRSCAHIFTTREYVGRVSNTSLQQVLQGLAREIKDVM